MTIPNLATLDPSRWPRRWYDELEERTAIIGEGMGISWSEAWPMAKACVLRQWERETKREAT